MSKSWKKLKRDREYDEDNWLSKKNKYREIAERRNRKSDMKEATYDSESQIYDINYRVK